MRTRLPSLVFGKNDGWAPRFCYGIWSTMYNLFKFKQWTGICVWQIRFSVYFLAYWRAGGWGRYAVFLTSLLLSKNGRAHRGFKWLLVNGKRVFYISHNSKCVIFRNFDVAEKLDGKFKRISFNVENICYLSLFTTGNPNFFSLLIKMHGYVIERKKRSWLFFHNRTIPEATILRLWSFFLFF